MHAFITQHVNYDSIMRWRSAQKQKVQARALPPCLVDLWRFALAAQHTAVQNKYMPDVDPNVFVHQPPPLLVELKGGTYTPTELEKTLWSAAPDGAPDMVLAKVMDHRLNEALNSNNPDLEDRPLAEKLQALSGSGGAILNE